MWLSCACVVGDAAWQNPQPPSCRFHVADRAATFCPVWWHKVVLHVPNEPGVAATAVFPPYAMFTVEISDTRLSMWVVWPAMDVLLVARWQSEHTIACP